MTFQQIYEAISALPLRERLWLVERVVHDAVESPKDLREKRTAKGSPLDGLFSNIRIWWKRSALRPIERRVPDA